jgi:uroporphyrinogen-III synthase
VHHYPVIRTVPIKALDEAAKAAWAKATHVLFTSRSAVKHWSLLASVEGKKGLTIGAATAALLEGSAKIAPVATQEGVIELLKTIDLQNGLLFWPRSAQARPVLAEYLTKANIPFYALDLYETKWQKPEPVPNLDDFDEIVFTSPTTVNAFLKIFGPLPKDKILTAIGPVTEILITKSDREQGTAAQFLKYSQICLGTD